ncbi:MAG: hypothetical protein BECKG1743D_GA0114223_109411, partial [Candidatus Kentron sp. G]
LLMTDLEILYKTMAKINKLRWSPALVGIAVRQQSQISGAFDGAG